ncbi:MAG: hypothetical protein IJP90_12215 [Treponema sp.]|nr:hypothetical protein [Lachnospiraceae bacterium]MBR0100458.1 hypothetical protein [Treponema sp.]
MRTIKYFFVFLLFISILSSCSKQEDRIKKLWKVEESINYQNYGWAENAKIESLLKSFCLEEKVDITNWNSGYSQQCYILRTLYFEEIIPKEVFLNRCISIYERYVLYQNRISFHTAAYAVCLYYAGQTEKANDIFMDIVRKSDETNFNSDIEYTLVVSVCSKLLYLNNSNSLKIDNEFYYMSEEDIINTFCGN